FATARVEAGGEVGAVTLRIVAEPRIDRLAFLGSRLRFELPQVHLASRRGDRPGGARSARRPGAQRVDADRARLELRRSRLRIRRIDGERVDAHLVLEVG